MQQNTILGRYLSVTRVTDPTLPGLKFLYILYPTRPYILETRSPAIAFIIQYLEIQICGLLLSNIDWCN